jgi:hypothetical protein
MVTFILNTVSAILFPLAFPILADLLSKVNIKPVKTSPKNGKIIIQNDIPVFLKQLPTSYLSNIFWVFIISINEPKGIEALWMIYCIIMVLIQIFLIIYTHGKPKKRIYYILLFLFGVIILIITIIKLFHC